MPTRIIRKRCNNCCICMFQCGGFVYEYQDDSGGAMVKAVRPKDCVDCLICVERCPQQAIQLFFKGEKFHINAESDDFFPTTSDA